MKIIPEEPLEEQIIEYLFGPVIKYHRTPVKSSIFKLLQRSIMDRCIQCGRDKINHKGVYVCPVHGLNPGERPSDHPVNPKH